VPPAALSCERTGYTIMTNARLIVGVGAVATVIGVIFALQGFSVMGGSAMSGSSVWAVLGPVIAVAGVIACAVGLRRARRHATH
jgi:hypothetical protein